MSANQDFKDLFAAFNAAAVEFMVVGAHAANLADVAALEALEDD